MPYTDQDIAGDAEDLNQNELMLLGIVDGSPTKITRIQKLGLFIEKILNLGPECSHGAYNYGAYSDGLDEAVSSMKGDGAIKTDQGDYVISSYGSSLLVESKKDPEKRKFLNDVSDIRSFLSSLSDRQLLHLSYVLFPETTDKSLIKDHLDLSRPSFRIADLHVTTNLSVDELVAKLTQKLESIRLASVTGSISGSISVDDVPPQEILDYVRGMFCDTTVYITIGGEQFIITKSKDGVCSMVDKDGNKVF